MESYYTRLTENLGKLKRNETQMDAAQRERYKKPLRKLKEQIREDATETMKAFLVMGCRFLKADSGEEMPAFQERAGAIIDAAAEEGDFKKASRILFKEYDTDKFLEALCPLHTQIHTEAYSPYWLKHCKATGEAQFPYYNDIIGMHWWEGHGEWAATKEEGGRRDVDFTRGVTIMLPPTSELIDEAYEKEMAGYGKD